MTNVSGANTSERVLLPEALRTLSEYLELSLDAGASLVVIRHTGDVATMYVGDAAEPREELKRRGTIPAALANEILNATRAGANLMDIDGKTYRFFRSFALMDDVAAVVFTST